MKQYKTCEFSTHAMERSTERRFKKDDVRTALKNGTVIEMCENATPNKRCLVLGYLKNGDPLHVVVAFKSDCLLVVTAYKPSCEKWYSDFKTRRREQ